MTRTKIKQLLAASSASLLLALSVGMSSAAAAQVDVECPTGTHQQGNNCKVVICHRTDAVKNPYVSIDVDIDASGPNGLGDHFSEHDEDVLATSETVAQELKDNDQKWGDIIPPVDVEGVEDGLNWTTEGQAIYNNGECNGVVTTPGGEEPGNPGTPQVLGDTTVQVTTKPVGSVAAGNGGAKELSPVSVVGLTGSLAVLVTGAAFAVKRFVRL
jgi:hypothetical protein